MLDQAANLRRLIDTAGPDAAESAAGLPMIAVTGGQSGVGVTTVAVNLAAVLADRGQRVLLLDVDAERAAISEAAGVRAAGSEPSLSDVLAGKCGIADAMVAGPAGTRVLAPCSRIRRGGRGCEFSPRRIFDRRSTPTRPSRHAQQRLLAELQSGRDDIDVIVLDTGNGITPWTRRFWLRSRLVLLVTTTDGPALVDTYAALKLGSADASPADVRLLVNQCEDERIAAAVHQRLSNACQRFLARTVPSLPSLPRHVGSGEGGGRSWPRVWEAPNSPFGHAAMWLGRAVSDLLSQEGMLDAGRRMQGALDRRVPAPHIPHPASSPSASSGALSATNV